MDRHLKLAAYITLPLLLIAVWTLWVAPIINRLPADFSYTANILSLDNFYDEASQKYQGQHISKSSFSYHVAQQQPDYLTIKNDFDVRTLSDHPIFSVSRTYYINPYTWQHVRVFDHENRQGFLFGPHYANKKPFYYWHVNYDAPALMQYVETEIINGLKVYHYRAHYVADQTANLDYLPNVPETRGVKTDVLLQIWIEPISGWLIKYQDNSVAYYYDKITGKTLAPWNRFSNRYTEVSISQKVHEARRLKWKFIIIDFGVPILMAWTAIMAYFRNTLVESLRTQLLPFLKFYIRNKHTIWINCLVLALTIALIGSFYFLIWYEKPPSRFKVGIAQWNLSDEQSRATQGFKDGLAEFGFVEGKNVEYVAKNAESKIINDIGIVQGFVGDKVNIIFVLTTPGVRVAKGSTTEIPIVFTDVSYPIEATPNIVGTLNYILPAKQFFQLDVPFPNTKILGFVHHTGDPDSDIQFQEYQSTLSRRNIKVVDISAIDVDEIKSKLASALKATHFNALFIACDSLMQQGGGRIAAQFSVANKIPSLTCDKDSVMNGAMIGYFADLYTMGKKAGAKAALILKGADPRWLAIDTPKSGYLMVNLNTARTLGITIPLTELQRANVKIGH